MRFSLCVDRFGYTVARGSLNPPLEPYVCLELRRWQVGEAGQAVITAGLVTEEDIDGYVEALKAELDSMGAKAKCALRLARVDVLPKIREAILAPFAMMAIDSNPERSEGSAIELQQTLQQ